jgi:hypothetical protein
MEVADVPGVVGVVEVERHRHPIGALPEVRETLDAPEAQHPGGRVELAAAKRGAPAEGETALTIEEEDRGGGPEVIAVHARGPNMELTLRFNVGESVATTMALTRTAEGAMNFLQLGGEYQVTGTIGDREVNFTARGSAETFRY